MRRLALLLLLLMAFGAAPALGQGGLPGGDLIPTPTPAPLEEDDDGDLSGTTIALISGGALALLIGLGWFITRDARHNLSAADRRAVERGDPGQQADDERMAGGKRGKAKAKARKRSKAQRQARKANRPR